MKGKVVGGGKMVLKKNAGFMAATSRNPEGAANK